MDLLEHALPRPLCGGRVIGREMARRGVFRGAFLPRSGEPRRIAFLAHATKSNRQIGMVFAAKLGTLSIIDALTLRLEPGFVHPAGNSGDAVSSTRPIFPAGTTASFFTESWRCRPASGPRPEESHSRPPLDLSSWK